MFENEKHNYSDFKKKKYWHYDDVRRLSLGYIVKCDKDDDFGLVYGYEQHFDSKSSSHRTWMYYFPKEKTLSLGKYTIVSFMKSSHRSHESETYEVSDIHLLSDYTIIDTNDKKTRGEHRFRELNWTCYDIEWNLVENGYSYMVIDEFKKVSLMYPLIDDENRIIVYHVLVKSIKDEVILTSLLSCYVGLNIYKAFYPYPKQEYLVQKFDSIKKYVDNFNLEKTLLKFYVGESGTYYTRPGKDWDHACINNYFRTTSKDLYMLKIAKLYENESWRHYDSLWDWDGNYNRINEEESICKRDEIKALYNKDAHYLFLIDEFMRQVHNKQEMCSSCLKNINSYIVKEDKNIFEIPFSSENYKSFVKYYNILGGKNVYNKWIKSLEKDGIDITDLEYLLRNNK